METNWNKLFGVKSSTGKHRGTAMKSAAVRRTAKAAHKAAPVKVDITKLSDAELDALDEKTFVASPSPKLRRIYLVSGKLKGAFR